MWVVADPHSNKQTGKQTDKQTDRHDMYYCTVLLVVTDFRITDVLLQYHDKKDNTAALISTRIDEIILYFKERCPIQL